MAVHVLRDPPLSIDFGEMRSYVCEIDFDQHVLSGFVRNSPHLSVNKRWIDTPWRVPTVGQRSVAKQVNRRARQAFTSPASRGTREPRVSARRVLPLCEMPGRAR